MGTLSYPPQIESKLPAFYGNIIKIPFVLSKAVSRNDFDRIWLRLKTVTGNIEKFRKDTLNVYYDAQTKNYCAKFDNYDLVGTEGQYFKAQIAFGSGTTELSAWSSVGIIKCTKSPILSISNLQHGVDNINFKTYTGIYRNEDTTEKVYSYRFTIYDFDNNIVETSGDLIHNTSNDEIINSAWQSTDTWQTTANLVDGKKYRIGYSIKTINDCYVETDLYTIKNSSTVDANLQAKLLATVDNDNGCISLSLIKPKDLREEVPVTGNFVISRYSDNLQTWNEVCKFNLLSQYPSTVGTLWTDYTIEHGVKYLYALQAYNSNGLYSNKMYSVVANGNGYIENDEDGNPYYIFADFEDAFLTDGERQLKIRFNPKVSSFKTNILESKIDTLGGQYPFIFRNGNVKYSEFPISGLLSYLGDEQELFVKGIKPEEYDAKRQMTAAAGSAEHRRQANRIPNAGTQLTSDNFYRERQFKMQALEWLMNDQPKLFRSPGEGSYIVRLMNTSLTPNDQLGRMLHTFSSTAYEIAEHNFNNLKNYNLLNLPDGENRTMKYAQVKLSEQPNPYQPIYGMYGAYILDTSPGTEYTLQFNKATTSDITIGATGAYYINIDNDDYLEKITKKSGDINNTATLNYGYYDTSVPDSFSYISNIITTDAVGQIIGYDDKINVIEDKINDVHREAGRFYQIIVQRRHIEPITGNEPAGYTWSDATIYLDTRTGKYYSGNPINNIYLGTEEPEAYFKLNNKYIIDLSTGGIYLSTDIPQAIQPTNPDAAKHFACITQGHYWVDTDFGPITALHLSPGAMIDFSYELKEIEYTIEKTNQTVKTAKETWEANRQSLSAYNNYITVLENALKEEGVNYAI